MLVATLDEAKVDSLASNAQGSVATGRSDSANDCASTGACGLQRTLGCSRKQPILRSMSAQNAASAELVVQEREGEVRFEVRVAPRASRAAIVGVHAGALKISLTSPPVDGAANEALIELLSDALRVPKRAVRIERGERSRSKSVSIEGVSAEQIRALVPA